ncbi:efflux transporter outer membrane subunit [Sulfuricurvum sp.]|uniref:efflux transporter outer membrane subunit n=1 Tax=Sulfuricurvum sp. TaxID=2025608 RepID=UPI00260A5E05|nr:efflux transporter outer membrane subunit [Sulfuricurvum sp.]MDD2266388.1 efflux transporter outer membrane subunit [Sulfuricurvum sp.]MDD2782971.1 efflux transporter outer membrane subunit [Sulfuricurvum sp.]
MNRISLSLILAGLLGGCAIGPDYVRPEVTAPETFIYNDVNKTNITTIDTQWWKQFNDPELTRSVESALSANYDLQASQASVDAILGKFDQAKSYLYPQINANGSLDRKSVDNATSGGYQLREGITSTYASSLSLVSYEIDLFGKVRRANEAARATLLSTEYASQTLKISIASNVAASYIKLSSIQGQIDLARENLSVTQEIAHLNEFKYKHGVIAESVLLQSLSEVESAKATLSQLEAAKISEESTFNLLLGRNPSKVAVSDLNAILLPDVPAALPSDVLNKRPDIASAEQNLIAANAQIGVARAAYFPSIKLTGMLGIQSMELSNFVSNPAKIWELTPSVSIPVFSAGLISGQIKTAEADRNQTLAVYKKTIVSAFNDTDNAIGQTAKAKEQITYQTARTAAIQKALMQSKLRYQVGTIAYSDMLLVQQQWLQASQQLLIAKQNALTSTIALYKALGGGWNQNQTPPLPNLLPAGR